MVVSIILDSAVDRPINLEVSKSSVQGLMHYFVAQTFQASGSRPINAHTAMSIICFVSQQADELEKVIKRSCA
ncbi:MAG: hypothetical protein ABFS45_10040 [Pseudomonadota bacterium]